jgi:hypothetical protein
VKWNDRGLLNTAQLGFDDENGDFLMENIEQL